MHLLVLPGRAGLAGQGGVRQVDAALQAVLGAARALLQWLLIWRMSDISLIGCQLVPWPLQCPSVSLLDRLDWHVQIFRNYRRLMPINRVLHFLVALFLLIGLVCVQFSNLVHLVALF